LIAASQKNADCSTQPESQTFSGVAQVFS